MASENASKGDIPLNLSSVPSKPETESLSLANPTQLHQEGIPASLLGSLGNNMAANNIGIPHPLLQVAGIEKSTMPNSMNVSSLSSMVANLSSIATGQKGKQVLGKSRNMAAADPVKMIAKRRLQELVTKIDPAERLDAEAEEVS